MKTLSIVVPCYNEEETIRPFLEATKVVEAQMAEVVTFDYIFVNDGSKDATLEVLREVSREFENVHYLSFSRNFGKEAGLLAGLERADGDVVTVMDADLQDPPELIPEMIQEWEKGYDDVYAKRKKRGKESWLREKLSITYYKILQKNIERMTVSHTFCVILKKTDRLGDQDAISQSKTR